ncbi:MAG: hypothetical protein IT159_08840 [Bryobacterales bacterium]|nr:hypothetical protein [Bryobacterales bacterium]
MTRLTWALSRILFPLAMAALPLVLLFSSIRTLAELDRQRTVFLRNRAAATVGRLETAPRGIGVPALVERLSEDEPALAGIAILAREDPGAGAPALTPLWEGREMFRTEVLREGGAELFRAYVPFQSENGLRIARIDLDAGAADFLVTHARHNVIIASLSGLVLVSLSLYAVWAYRRAARLEVRQLELQHLAQLGEMSAVLAHEIRNPLGTIKGFAQLLGEQAGEGARGPLDLILDEVRRLENLVGDLLLYGRPPAPEIRPVRWTETLAPLRAHAEHLLASRDARFVADEPRIEWDTDPRLLQHALVNLLRNAAEAVGDRPGGEVRLEVRRPGSGGLEIAVADNGPGISEDARGKLFQPFFTTRPFGTGLGLSIARSFARSLGGELALSNSALGGVRAVLRFPGARPRETTMEDGS